MANSLGERIVALARTMIGTPYGHTGRQPGVALDCIGLLACVAHELNITQYDDRNYSPEGSPDRLTGILLRYATLVGLFSDGRSLIDEEVILSPGDILQFAILGEPRHCGILADDRGIPTVIHAYQSVGKVVEHPFDIHWRRRLWAAYRLRAALETG